MGSFSFHPELFELRTLVLEALADHEFAWLSDFGSVDLMHDIYGIEVCGIIADENVAPITALLCKLFPTWPHLRSYYKESFTREPGWKVQISRDRQEFGDRWQSVDS
jgi:hypothetical protein